MRTEVTKSIVAFRNFVKGPKNDLGSSHLTTEIEGRFTSNVGGWNLHLLQGLNVISAVPSCFILKYIKKVKVKQSRYRPGVAQRVPENYGSQIT